MCKYESWTGSTEAGVPNRDPGLPKHVLSPGLRKTDLTAILKELVQDDEKSSSMCHGAIGLW